MREIWTFNGASLSARGMWDVEGVIEGIGIPKFRGSDLQVPFQHGARWIKKRFDRRKVVFSMWIKGENRESLDLNIDAFLKAVGRPGLHPLIRTMKNGSIRTAQAELCSEIHFIRTAPSHAKFALELELADPFFYGSEEASETKPAEISPLTWTHINEGTAPATAMTITLTGPLSNPILRNQNSGIWLEYPGTIASGESVVFDTRSFTCQKGEENHISLVRHGGDSYWMILAAGENSMVLETETIGGGVTIVYHPAFF